VSCRQQRCRQGRERGVSAAKAAGSEARDCVVRGGVCAVVFAGRVCVVARTLAGEGGVKKAKMQWWR